MIVILRIKAGRPPHIGIKLHADSENVAQMLVDLAIMLDQHLPLQMKHHCAKQIGPLVAGEHRDSHCSASPAASRSASVRSDARRVGEEGGRTCRIRWAR